MNLLKRLLHWLGLLKEPKTIALTTTSAKAKKRCGECGQKPAQRVPRTEAEAIERMCELPVDRLGELEPWMLRYFEFRRDGGQTQFRLKSAAR
jgi:hypothetical protein